MGCCGKIITKVGRIAIGYTNLARDKKYEFTDDRIRACQKCIWNTWLTKDEYTAFLLRHNIKILTNFTQLEKLPLLPKHALDARRRGLYCRICKCFIPTKASIEDEDCLKGFWPKRLNSPQKTLKKKVVMMDY